MSRNIKIEKNYETGRYDMRLEGHYDQEPYTLADYLVYKEKTDEATLGQEKLEQIFKSNLSSEFSILIQNAGRWCERFASDVVIGIESVNKTVDNPLEFFENNRVPNEELGDPHIVVKSFLFGFRRDGVDHYEFIKANANGKGNGIFEYYRAIYELAISIKRYTQSNGEERLKVGYNFCRLD